MKGSGPGNQTCKLPYASCDTLPTALFGSAKDEDANLKISKVELCLLHKCVAGYKKHVLMNRNPFDNKTMHMLLINGLYFKHIPKMWFALVKLLRPFNKERKNRKQKHNNGFNLATHTSGLSADPAFAEMTGPHFSN